MRTGRPIPPLTLTDAERETLERWARRAKTAQAVAQRARVILGCAAGKTNTVVAHELRLTKQTVGKNGERGYRALTEALRRTRRVAVGTFTWRGKTTPIAIRLHEDGLLLQRLYFAGEVYNAAEIDRGAEPKIRDQERTLAERLISELSATEFRPKTTRTSTGSGS